MKPNFNFLRTAFIIFNLFFFYTSFSQEEKENKIMKDLYNEAREYFIDDQLEKAEEKYKELLKIDSTNEKGLYGLLLNYNIQKKYGAIISEFEKHEESFNNKATKVRYYFCMGVAYFFEDNPEEGITYIKKYLNLVDSETLNKSDFLTFAIIYFDYETYDSALVELQNFYDLEETAWLNDEVTFLHFKILYEMDQHDKALERVEDLLAELELEDQTVFLMNVIDYTTSDESLEGAKPYLERILSEPYSEYLDKSVRAYCQYVLGVLSFSNGEEEQGIKHLKDVSIEHLDEEYKPNFYNAILLQTINNDFKGFQKYVELAKQDYPDEFYFEAIHGMFHAQLGNENKADKYFIKSFQKKEIGDFYNHSEILTKINDYYTSRDKDDESLYHKVKDIPDVYMAHFIAIGQISYNYERMTVGDKFFELAIDMSTNEKNKSKIHYLQSLFYIRIMLVDQAKDFLDQAYALDNQNYYLLCKQYYELAYHYYQDSLSSKAFEKLLEIAQKTEEGPQEVISFLTAMAHFNLDQKEEACEVIEPMLNNFSIREINAKIFCMKYAITSRQFEESFKLISAYMIKY